MNNYITVPCGLILAFLVLVFQMSLFYWLWGQMLDAQKSYLAWMEKQEQINRDLLRLATKKEISKEGESK